ncbi:MAG: hypothetical protein ACXVWZ_13705 [Nocardioides sp.]
MSILVDYRCAACGTRTERWAPSPPPATAPCACGAEGRRVWASVGFAGSRPAPADPAPVRRPGPSLCASYPQVPGLCHMSESAGRMWVAKYLKDGRAVDREQERQETRAATVAPTMADAITHTHHDHPAPAAG